METERKASPMVELKIRGKRRARKSDAANCPARKRGRPMKRVSELLTTKKRVRLEAIEVLQQQKGVAMNSEPRDWISELERLPVELIQQIFLHSLELNLLRASTTLARTLSKESIYSSLILLAFFDDDGKQPVDGRVFAPAQYRELDLAEKIHLQTSILNSRWCTLHRLQHNLPALSRLATIQAWHEERHRELQTDTLPPKAPPITPSPALQAIATLPAIEDLEATEQHFLARSEVGLGYSNGENSDSSTFLPRLRTWTSSKGKDGQTYKTIDGARGIVNNRHIPRRLLLGSPWTPEKLAFLKFIRQGWRFLQKDFVLKISSAALFEGMASAIAESNTEALKILLELHFAAFQEENSHTGVTASGRTRHTVSFSHPVPLELFHLATRQQRSEELVALLLREGIDSICDDAILTKWALRSRSEDSRNTVAKWLLKHMEGTEDYGLNGSSLFVNGNMTWRRAAGEYPFREISFTDELGYLKDGATEFIPQLLDDL